MHVALAPMDGITDCAYRIVCKEIFASHHHPDDTLMLWTEFMSANGFYHNPPGVMHHLLRSDYDHETIVQIFGGDEDMLLHAARVLDQHYTFAGIELNMGCPSPKIMSCAAGSGMLRDKARTLGIIQRLAEHIQRPFSIKTRVWLTADDKDEQFQFLLDASTYVWCIAVHGRTYKQSHAGDVDRDFIYRLKAALPDKVIIGNGGLRSYTDMQEKQQGVVDGAPVTLDGMMPAQSAIGNPWILTPHSPTIMEKRTTLCHHLDLMMATHLYLHRLDIGKSNILPQPTRAQLAEMAQRIHDHPTAPELASLKAPIEFRKFLFTYISGIPDNKSLKKAVPPARDYASLREVLARFADEHIARLV